MRKSYFIFLLAGILASCSKSNPEAPTLFQEISPENSGVSFRNDLGFDEEFNIFTYRNYYNGGGVALGDVNNDGLVDIYLSANQGPNKLYLNKGNLQFEDVTDQAGVAGTRAWSTGVAMADVNGDGFLDIYVCNSGDVSGDNKQNELFINQGDGTFREQAEEYGLADQGFSTHAVFFDYDKDGDLDVYLLNNSYQAIGSFNKMQNERPKRDPVGGDKLFRNDGGKFVDVSEAAGIYGSIIGFGLGITIGDVNQDTWPDIFISNDFFEKDYLYLNNQDGTFTEALESQMRSISAASMGADIADVNGDGFLDIYVCNSGDVSGDNKQNELFINQGDGTFREQAEEYGLADQG
ncbi:MAG: VCBS repeat-containing protein, partial [Cyclobacteriaceae bacterium]|nr:VCBS repeat-containing protein [Cyclobacteriaceae bacterium]MDX5466278.1 VCBS repeat-containing protein [Cyclobacteriaceae bacterium]